MAMPAKAPSWMVVFLPNRMSWPLIEVVGSNQRVTGRVGAGNLTDGSAPLQFELGQLALEETAGEEIRVQPTQCQVDDDADVQVVAPHDFFDHRFGERQGNEQVECTGQRWSFGVRGLQRRT